MTDTPVLIGKTVSDALKYCVNQVPGNWYVRVTCRDGVHFPVTRDYREDRINVEVADGIVVAQNVG